MLQLVVTLFRGFIDLKAAAPGCHDKLKHIGQRYFSNTSFSLKNSITLVSILTLILLL